VEESFLDGIFRVFVREDDGTSDSVRTPLVCPHQFRERFGLTALGRNYQCLLALARRVT
jgi:hypothetical protein